MDRIFPALIAFAFALAAEAQPLMKKYTFLSLLSGATAHEITSDGGDIMGIYVRPGLTDPPTVGVLKLDATSAVEWSYLLDVDSLTVVTDIEEKPDGGYVLVGMYRTSPGPVGEGDLVDVVMELDAAGQVVWSRQLRFTFPATPVWKSNRKPKVNLDQNGDILVTYSAGMWLFIARLSPSGSLLWSTRYEPGPAVANIPSECASVLLTAAGSSAPNAIITASTYWGQNDTDPFLNSMTYLVCTDGNGTMVWSRNLLIGEGVLVPRDLVRSDNDELVMVGDRVSWDTGMGFLLVMDSLGQPAGSLRRFGMLDGRVSISALVAQADGSWLVEGGAYSFPSEIHMTFMAHLDNAFNVLSAASPFQSCCGHTIFQAWSASATGDYAIARNEPYNTLDITLNKGSITGSFGCYEMPLSLIISDTIVSHTTGIQQGTGATILQSNVTQSLLVPAIADDCVATQTESVSDVASFSVAPVPSHEVLRVGCASDVMVFGQPTIVDAMGRHILYPKPMQREVEDILAIDVSPLPPGVFVLRLSTSIGAVPLKFIKE